MIIVGELINASRKSVGTAIENNDDEVVKKLALDQAENGADYIDVNAGVFVGKEVGYLKWLVETVQAAADKPCSIDSPDPRAIEAALAVHKGTAMINSISLEKERYDALLPIVAALAYEFTKFTARNHDRALIKLLTAPGFWLQRLTTREPEDSMLEVSIAALRRVLKEDGAAA